LASLAFAVVTEICGAAVAADTYWGVRRAERSLIVVNPQVFTAKEPSAPRTLVVSAVCKGVGPRLKTVAGDPLYHVFDCSLTVDYDGNSLLVHLPPTRWCAYTHHGIDEIVRYGGGWVAGCG
jgi:hypothetical protein